MKIVQSAIVFTEVLFVEPLTFVKCGSFNTRYV